MSPPLAKRARPCLETLEDRTVPSVTISVANASLNEIGNPSAFIAAGSGGLSTPVGITLGPDGNLYVASNNNNSVLCYNGTTGAFISTFVSQGSGGLGFTGQPAGLTFGPDGNLYVTSTATNQVLEYNGSTGAFIGVFVSAGSGGLVEPRSAAFGPDGNLYVTSRDINTGLNGVMRYQGLSGASPGSPLPAAGETWAGAAFTPIFAPQATDGGGARELLFGPDGNLYVDGGNTQGINRYDGTTGAFLGVFVSQGTGTQVNGRGMAFDPEGRLYVGDVGDAVHRYDTQGNSLGDLLVNAVNPSLKVPEGVTFDTQGRLLIACSNSNNVVRYDRGVTVSLSAASSTAVSVSYTTADGSAKAGTDYYALSGTVTFNPGQTSREILLATQETASLDGNDSFTVQLSNPTGGATIATGTATVTIVDPTRSFAVADTSSIEGDHTAHYRGAFAQGVPGDNFYVALAFGPDGNLYTAGAPTGLSGLPADAIGRFNGTTGAYMGQFTSGQNGQVRHIAFHGGYLFVAAEESNDVVRYDATTGAFVDVFVQPGSGGISAPYGVAFGPDGNLYVSGRSSNTVVKYDGSTGAYLATFVTSGSGGLNLPEGMAFDPSGAYLYVASSGSAQVLKYNASTGAYVGVAASAGVSGPHDVTFGLDGLLYVLSGGNNRILRYTESGTYVDDYVPAGSGGMSDVHSMAFGPDGDLYVTGVNPSQILRFGTENEALFTVTNTTASTISLTVNYATADGTAIAGTNYTATSGTFTFAPGVTSDTIRVPLLDSGSQTAPLTFTLTLSNPQAATLSRGQATATIAPSDQAAKFYVVNDATSSLGGTNTTYKYQSSGTQQAPYGLNIANLDPRGIAANSTGTTYWVADLNKNVYVYSATGTLLGSWSAAGLSSTTTIGGIATNGTDIWLLDTVNSKIYKYSGAASLRSGSQSAASSFKLSKNNSNATGIVTDGTSIWVVNSSGTSSAVYKYSVAGKSQGNWTIDPADTSPNGVTINPNSVSDIWIVDSGTKKVYDYTSAASKTSGSQNAASSFALAANNINPVGIADPPVEGVFTVTPSAPLAVMTSPVMQPTLAPSPANSRDAFFAMLGSAPSTGSVNQIAQRPAERIVPANLPPSPEATPILAARSDLVFAGLQQGSDDLLSEMPVFSDEEGSEVLE
jgi:DNA-binding beta-propeller fold protein YncE